MSDYFFNRNLDEEWKNLYEKMVHTLNRMWEAITRNYHRWPEVTIQNIENNDLLKALPRLLPLATELQNDESLHSLMPWQHHGELDLRLMDWEKQTTHAFISIIPNRENEFQISVYDENMPLENYGTQVFKTLDSVPLGEIRSLIHAELQARIVQQQKGSADVR